MLGPVLGDALSHDALAAWVLVVEDAAPVAGSEIGEEDFGVGEAVSGAVQFCFGLSGHFNGALPFILPAFFVAKAPAIMGGSALGFWGVAHGFGWLFDGRRNSRFNNMSMNMRRR